MFFMAKRIEISIALWQKYWKQHQQLTGNDKTHSISWCRSEYWKCSQERTTMVIIRGWPNAIVTNTFQPTSDITTIFLILVSLSSMGIELHSYSGSYVLPCKHIQVNAIQADVMPEHSEVNTWMSFFSWNSHEYLLDKNNPFLEVTAWESNSETSGQNGQSLSGQKWNWLVKDSTVTRVYS